MSIRIIIFLATALTLSGCLKIYIPKVDIDKAIFHSPKGEFELKLRNHDSNVLIGSDGEYPVWISVFPIKRITVLKMSSIKNTSIKIESSKAYYQLNNGKKINLKIKRSLYYINDFDIIAPSTIDYYSEYGGGLHVSRKRKKITKNHMEKMKQETHHYYIPILINNESYAIDVTYRLKAKSSSRFAVPGMP